MIKWLRDTYLDSLNELGSGPTIFWTLVSILLMLAIFVMVAVWVVIPRSSPHFWIITGVVLLAVALVIELFTLWHHANLRWIAAEECRKNDARVRNSVPPRWNPPAPSQSPADVRIAQRVAEVQSKRTVQDIAAETGIQPEQP